MWEPLSQRRHGRSYPQEKSQRGVRLTPRSFRLAHSCRRRSSQIGHFGSPRLGPVAKLIQNSAVRGWKKAELKSDGGREGDRTLDLGVANAALSQLSYSPVNSLAFLAFWFSMGQGFTGSKTSAWFIGNEYSRGFAASGLLGGIAPCRLESVASRQGLSVHLRVCACRSFCVALFIGINCSGRQESNQEPEGQGIGCLHKRVSFFAISPNPESRRWYLYSDFCFLVA
jgi:hypothetical protein